MSKPLEIKDFAGGLTDNFFQGEPNRAEKLENLLVGIDHGLESRFGTLVKNNPAKSARINSIESFNSFTDLVYSSEGHFYDIDGAEILGPTGNIAFVGATADAVYTSAELQGEIVLACDEILQPQKIYRDSLGALQVRTAGIPEVKQALISEANLLTECIAAANLLRIRFLAHLDSAENLDTERDGTSPNYLLATEQPPTSIKAHWSVDKYARYYFDNTTTFSFGQWRPNGVPDATVNPNPALAATDYDSLVALLEALNLAFEEHRVDSTGYASVVDSSDTTLIFGPNRYHALGYQTQFTDGVTNFGFSAGSALISLYAKPLNQGIQQRITENPDPNSAINASIAESKVYRTKLIQIATFLDDFAVKFCLHEVAPFVHRYNFQNAQGNTFVNSAFAHQFLAPILTDKPVIIPTPFNFIYAANYVQRAFENHALNSDKPSTLNATYPTMHTERNESIVSGLQQAGYYFAALPPTPTVRQQYTAFAWDVISAKIAIFTAKYSYFVHSIDLLSGSQDARIDMDASAGVPGNYTAHLVATLAGPNYTAAYKGMVLHSSYTNRTSNQAPRQQSFNGITSNDGLGNYHVCFSAIGFTYTNFSVGTFVMHPYPMMSGSTDFPSFSTTPQYLKSFGYAPDIYDLSGWIDGIKDFYDAFKEHLSTVNTHFNIAESVFEFLPTPIGETVPEGGVQSNLLPDVNLPNVQPQFILPALTDPIKGYGYAFTYSDSYLTEDGRTFLVESKPVFTDIVNSEQKLAVGVTVAMYSEPTMFITNEIITPVAMIVGAENLTNTADTNYSTATLLNVYRTEGDEATTYYKVNTITAPVLTSLVWPTITFYDPSVYDLVSDYYVIDGNPKTSDSPILYTNGGVSPTTQPPKSKYVWAANGYVYYGGVYDGDEFYPNKVVQSVQLNLDGAPARNYVDFDAPVVGGGAARNVNICLTETGVFRLEGAFGTDGSGAIVKQQISNQIGGISGASIVVTEIGLFFAGTNGFYHTDGYQCIRISQELYKTYQRAIETAAQKRAVKGVYDRTNRRVYWTMRSDSLQTDADKIFVFDLNFGITPSGTFTRLAGAIGSWNPSSLGSLGNTLYIGDADGYLYYFDQNTKTDPAKDLLAAPNTWGDTYIPWEYRSPMMNFGGTALRKFFSRIHHVGKNLGGVALQYYITADNRVTQDLAPMRFIDDGSAGLVDQWRRVGGKKLRADLYQVGVKNGRFTVYNSDTYGGTPVFVSHIATDTTITMTGAVLPTDSVGMSMCFASDYYATEFLIKSVTIVGPNTTVVLVDPLNKANSLLALGWEIRGYMKEQAFSLDALTIWFEEQGNLGSQYRGYSSTEGGGGNK